PAVRRNPQQTKGKTRLDKLSYLSSRRVGLQLRQKLLGGSCRRSFALCTEIPSFLEPIEGGLGPGRGEWPSGQKRQTVRILPLPLVCCRLKRRERRHSSAQEGPISSCQCEAPFFLPCREVKLYHSPDISNPNENRSEPLPL
ncbi:hypothetical protein S245_062479, partial [Arachis hypogaea]